MSTRTPKTDSAESRTRTRDPQATQAAILRAASQVFVEKGPFQASISEIAREAGVTKSLIHHHFGSKEALWDAVKSVGFGSYAEVQKQMLLEPGSKAELLRDSISTYFEFLRSNPNFVRFMSWMHLEEEEARPVEMADELIELGVGKIAEAQAGGEIRDDVHPFFILVSFIGLVTHWFEDKKAHCSWAENHPEVLDDRQYLDTLHKIFFEGVLPRAEGDLNLGSCCGIESSDGDDT